MAELTIVDNASAVVGLKECWKHRLQALKKELGKIRDASPTRDLRVQHGTSEGLGFSGAFLTTNDLVPSPQRDNFGLP